VASEAICGNTLELARLVTTGAIELGVRPCKGKLRETVVVELGPRPGVHGVAGFAIGWDSGAGVIEVRRLAIILQVACSALGREAGVNAGCGTLVARFAVRDGMRTDKGEAIAVLLDIVGRHFPSANRVALFAIGSHLAAMEVGVAS
jgi:hypothetical protein